MSGGQIDDASAAEDAPDAARHLPGFEQLLARQAARIAHRAPEAIEERVARKPPEITSGETSFR